MTPTLAPDRPIVLEGARIIDPATDRDETGTVVVAEGRIAACGPTVARIDYPAGAEIVKCAGKVVAPGLVDMRVFIGEPGHEHRETLATASSAAAAAGVTTMVTMPDTDPVIDDIALVDFMRRRARDTAIVNVRPMAALTRDLAGEEITELGLLQSAGAVAFTNGREPIANAGIMRRAMTYASDFDALIVHLPADPDLVEKGVMNEGEMATRLGLAGIPREAEIIMLERDIRLAALTGARYHAAQISCAASVDIMRQAKASGLDVSCGASIAHATLNETDIGPYRTFFKMTPPLRSEDDRRAVVAGIADGTIDVIVSSHDPQDVETKRHPFAEAADGAIGLETLLAAGLRLVHDDEVSLIDLIRALSTRPSALLSLEAGTLAPGSAADLVVIDLDAPWIMREEAVLSRSKNTPFEGARFTGRAVRTLVAGRTVYEYRG